jgi:hypothetical protein
MSKRLIGPVMLLALVVAGCGSSAHASAGSQPSTHQAVPATAAPSTAPASATAHLDPCTMLTADQVGAALGEQPAAGKPEPNFDAPECEWDPASGKNGTVTIDVGPWDGDPGVKPLRLGTPVSGIGDEAYDSGNTGLFVRKGSNGVRVWVFNVKTQSSRLDLEKQLATILLGKL